MEPHVPWYLYLLAIPFGLGVWAFMEGYLRTVRRFNRWNFRRRMRP